MGFDPLILAAGRLRHKVQIYAPNEQQPDAYGSMSTQWILVLTTRAEIVSTTSSSYKDAFSQNALSAQCTEMVTIRFPGTSVVVEPGYRVVFGDEVLTVQAVENVQRRNRVLRMACLVVDEVSS